MRRPPGVREKGAPAMGLFKADLFRSFAAGFVLGGLALVAVLGSGNDGLSSNVVPNAVAAEAPAR